jgi:hypothetical protein
MSAKGEMYTSKKSMMKHEMGESPAMRKKEYGSAKGGLFGKSSAKKAVVKKMGKKK